MQRLLGLVISFAIVAALAAAPISRVAAHESGRHAATVHAFPAGMPDRTHDGLLGGTPDCVMICMTVDAFTPAPGQKHELAQCPAVFLPAAGSLLTGSMPEASEPPPKSVPV